MIYNFNIGRKIFSSSIALFIRQLKPNALSVKNVVLLVIFSGVFIPYLLKGQEPAEVNSDNISSDSSKLALLNKSLEELIKVEVSVASVAAQTVFSSPSTVSVIDRRSIITHNFQTVAEALRTVAGIDIYYTVLDQTVPTSRGILQNFYANKILLMINGVSTWQPVYGNGQIERININDVERIEVLKGPASVLYGSNAFTGVINIVLLNHEHEKSTNDKLNAHIKVGYPRGGEGGCAFSAGTEKFMIFASGNAGVETFAPYKIQSKRGSTIYPNLPNQDSDSTYWYSQQNNSYNFNINAFYKSHSVYINDYIYQHTFPGIDPSYKQGGGTLFNNEGTMINYTFYKQLKVNSLRLVLSGTYDYCKRNWPDTFTRVTSLVLEGKRYELLAKANFKITEFLNGELGLEMEENGTGTHNRMNNLQDTVVRSNLRNSEHIHVYSAFGQVEAQVNNLSVLAGTRYTTTTISGNNVSSRLTASYLISSTNSIKLILGQAFRSPSMLELFFNHPTVIGNKNLKSETCTSYEMAYVFGHRRFFMQALVYYARYKNLIQRITPATGPPSVYHNVASFNCMGSEVELKYQNENYFDMYCNYNYMAGLGNDSKSNFNLVPKHNIRIGLSKTIKNIIFSTNGYMRSSVKGIHGTIPPQHFINLNLAYKSELKNGTAVIHTFGAHNITGSKMETPEYIRGTININSLQQMGYGRTFNYSIKLIF